MFPRFFRLIFLSFFVKQLRLGTSSVPTQQEAMAVLKDLLESGRITPVIDSTYPLSAAREAFGHMIEGKAQGRILLTPTGADP